MTGIPREAISLKGRLPSLRGDGAGVMVLKGVEVDYENIIPAIPVPKMRNTGVRKSISVRRQD